MRSASKPWWQQATALVSLSASGAITGFSFAPRTAAGPASPAGMPIRLMALQQAARSSPADAAQSSPASDATLRAAIVNVARYYLQMARSKTPAEMEKIIWQHDSLNGADHGPSCAAFASLTLELAAQVTGQRSWVTGGSSYPWPLHQWVDARVDPNPASLGIISILQDAQAHHRWHPLGDGYQPLPGDWVLFNGHVEVVTQYADGVLHTIGGDSLPNFSVNAHSYRDPLSGEGVVGFVDNGNLPGTGHGTLQVPDAAPAGHQGDQAAPAPAAAAGATDGSAAIPGIRATGPAEPGGPVGRAPARQADGAAIPGLTVTAPASAGAASPSAKAQAPQAKTPAHKAGTPGAAAIPGLPEAAPGPSADTPAAHHPSSAAAPSAGTSAQQAFIDEVAPGAVAAQRTYGVPAAVTIAQAIDESDWGRSELAAADHNLFGIKGTGPAGSVLLPTQEYENGRWVTVAAPFRVYHTIAESIDDHDRLLATSPLYRQAMADRNNPNAFAAALTGVYATDPHYGATLTSLMRQYDLYRYDAMASGGHQSHVSSGHASGNQEPASSGPAPVSPSGGAVIPGFSSATPASTSTPPAAPTPRPTASPAGPAPGHGSQPETHQAQPRRTPRPRRTTSGQVGPASRAAKAAPATCLTEGTACPSATARSSRHQTPIPPAVRHAFLTAARTPLIRGQPLYRDVASHSGIGWELLAACDWMQCEARPRYSPVHGEKLGTINPDGTVYRTKSAALEQCADDLAELAWAVYGIDVTAREALSVRDLADAFAAFRWGGLLKRHRTSAMEFPYSVAGLTDQHVAMRWPAIAEPDAPDKPGSRFRRPFGAVPIVLGLGYPATA